MIGCMSEHEVLSWARYGEAARELTRRLRDAQHDVRREARVAQPSRELAASLAYGLGCKNLFSVNVEFYTGEGTTLDAPVMLPPLLDPADLLDMRVLVVDDVAASGKTLELVLELCHGHVAQLRSAVLYQKPTSLLDADVVWQHTDRWIDFPWSTPDPG